MSKTKIFQTNNYKQNTKNVFCVITATDSAGKNQNEQISN